MSDKDFRSQLEGLFSDLEPIRAEEGRLAFPEDVVVDTTERQRAEAKLERQAVQLQAAAEVSRATTSVLDPEELLRQVVDLVRERFDLYYVGLFLLDEERHFAVLRAGTGEAGRKMLEAGHKLEVGSESMIGWCIANAQARIALDVTSASLRAEPQAEGSVEPGEEAVRFSNPLLPDTRSEMALPLVSRGQVIGAMTIQSTQTAAFSEEDITVLQTMADQLAIAIENARLFEETKSRLAQLTTLQETSKAVASTLELDRLLNLITQQATTLLQGNGGLINLVDWEKMEDEVVAACGSQAPYLGFPGPLEGSLSGWVILHNQPVISNQLQNDNRVHRRVRSGDVQVENAAIAPLTVRGQVIGSLVVNNKQGGFDQADLDLLSAFANQAATAIENARLFEGLTKELAERKAVEEALRASEERFTLAMQGSRDGLWDWDIANDTLYWSPRFKELLGYADDELDVDFDTLTSHLHPDDIELTNVAIEAHLKDRVPYEIESRLRAKSGEYRWFHTRGQAIWDDTGRPLRMVGSTTDITERKRTEESLRENEERFRLTVEATRDGLWENSLDHKRDFFSDRMFTMLGYEPMDPINAFDFFNSLLHPDDVKNFEEKYNAMNRPGHDDYSVGIRFKAKDGTWRHILSRGKCIERDEKGRPVRIVGTHTDIADLKRAEESLRKASEELERYTADLERRTVQLQAAAEVSRATTSVLDPDELLRQVVDLVRERFDLYYAGLFLLDQERQFAVLRAATGEAGRKMLEAGHKLEVGGESMIGWCIANAQARIALDVTSASLRAEPQAEGSVEPGEEAVRFSNPLLPETRSEMALPLVSRGQVIGAMTIQSARAAAFSEEDITVLQTMADQLASAIENARLFEDTKSRVAQLTALQETSKAVASTPELDKLLHLITQQATTLLQSDGGITNLADWENKEEEIVAACGSQIPYLGFRGPLEGSLSGWVILHNQPVISNQFQNDNRVDPRWRAEKERNQNAAIAPLSIKDQVMGTLVVMNRQGGKEGFGQADLDLLTAFANQAATAIENARLFEETRQTSFLLGRRVKELACLNDIGRQIEETPPVSEFLQWVTERIPPAMQYPDVCLAAIEFDGQVYGAAEAVNLPCQMVQALRIGGEVAGRVYIAYTENHDFLDEESALLGDMVRRVSGYIESRRLFEQTQAALAEMEATHRLYLREQWAEYVPTLASTSYERTQPGVTPLGDAVLPEDFETSSSSVETLNRAVEQVMARREMVVQSSTDDGVGQAPSTDPSTGSGQSSGQAILVAPISLRGEVIGALGLYDTGNKRRWTDEEIALIEAVADQMALAIENTRLFEQTQRRAAREKLLADITTRVRSSMDPQTILQTAARELGAALGADRAFVQLGKVTPVRSVTPATEGQETR